MHFILNKIFEQLLNQKLYTGNYYNIQILLWVLVCCTLFWNSLSRQEVGITCLSPARCRVLHAQWCWLVICHLPHSMLLKWRFVTGVLVKPVNTSAQRYFKSDLCEAVLFRVSLHGHWFVYFVCFLLFWDTLNNNHVKTRCLISGFAWFLPPCARTNHCLYSVFVWTGELYILPPSDAESRPKHFRWDLIPFIILLKWSW